MKSEIRDLPDVIDNLLLCISNLQLLKNPGLTADGSETSKKPFLAFDKAFFSIVTFCLSSLIDFTKLTKLCVGHLPRKVFYLIYDTYTNGEEWRHLGKICIILSMMICWSFKSISTPKNFHTMVFTSQVQKNTILHGNWKNNTDVS